jgi:hypothetical protein
MKGNPKLITTGTQLKYFYRNNEKELYMNSKIILFVLLLMCACSPAVATTTPLAQENLPTDVLPTATIEPTIEPASASAEEQIYPPYLLLSTKLEDVSQTFNGVTAQIDQAYVDEGRVAIQYTIFGLDWPDGTFMDPTQQIRMSIPALSDFELGGFSGAGGGHKSYVKQGVVTGSSDYALLDDALDAEKSPNINVNVDIPVEGPTKVGVFHLSFTVPVLNGIKIENIDQTVVANNVSITLKSLILNPSHAEALICFQMPSAQDWGLSAVKFTVGDREYPLSGGGLASAKSDPSSALTSSERCKNVGFDIAYDSTSDIAVTLTVPRLQASANEAITEEVVDRANQRLADQGIQFDYSNVGQGGNIVVLKRPAGATDEQLYPLIWDAMASQYEGPWVFAVEIPK